MSGESRQRDKGYVYTARVGLEKLQSLLQQLRTRVTLSWDLARLDFSGELREQGTAFNEKLEIRWRKIEDHLQVLVLSDEAIDLAEFKPVPGHWTIEPMHPEKDPNSVPTLNDLTDRRYSPQFSQYPIIGTEKGDIECRLFYRDDVAVFVSPRNICPHKDGRE